jgi:aryl-alcohol dehydrogenase-like predicted oxidoreductase
MLSPIVLGCEQLGGTDWGPMDATLASDAVRCAVECGVTAFDTADVYGLGRGETELSRVLGNDRHRLTIITKGGLRWTSTGGSERAAVHRDSSAVYLRSAIDRSLARLRIDAIPLYLIHWPDPRTPLDETLECLEQRRSEGKIRAYGLSNVDIATVRAPTRAFPIKAVEGPLSLLDDASALDRYAAAREAGLVTLTYGSLAQGFLTGKYNASSVFDHTDRRHRLKEFSAESWRTNGPILETLTNVAVDANRSPAQVAIRWVIDSGASSAVIVGAKSPAQVTENMQALTWSLTRDQFDRLSCARRAPMSS